MSEGIAVNIEGAAELDAALIALDRKVSLKFVTRGLRAGGKVIQKEAQANAPDLTGATRRSIKVRAGKSGKGVKTVVIGTSKKWFTGPVFYAAFLEFGHRVGKRKLGDARTEVPGLHFLEKAGASKKGEAVSAFTTSLKQDLASLTPAGGAT